MKLYSFYFHTKSSSNSNHIIDVNEVIGIDPDFVEQDGVAGAILYAITNKKDYANWFEKAHDMNHFYRTERHISKEEWLHVMGACSTAVLELTLLTTKKVDKNGKYQFAEEGVYMTEMEVQQFDSLSWDLVFSDVSEFQYDEFQRLLLVLKDPIADAINNTFIARELLESDQSLALLLDRDAVFIDMMSCYIKIFWNILRKE